ncbi:MAG: sigma-70 family RNA polymerase sigma factor [Planctomycetes bacterium]|nr:sigma-70 family RNA polymerase sigma factor [Planctomycetota bacterium]
MGGGEQNEAGPPKVTDREGQQQFVRLFVANQRRVHAFIRTLIPNTADADDVLQETSITGLSKFTSSFLRGRADPRDFRIEDFVAWICTIARYEALKWCRKVKRGRPLFSEALTAELADCHARQLDYLEMRHEALNHCLEKLSSRDRALLFFRYESDLTGPEIAERSGRPVNTIYKALQRIRHTLLECVDRTIRAQGHA